MDKYIHSQKYSLDFSRANLFRYHAKCIRIFICPISIVTNIFRYLFIQKKDIPPTLGQRLTFKVNSSFRADRDSNCPKSQSNTKQYATPFEILTNIPSVNCQDTPRPPRDPKKIQKELKKKIVNEFKIKKNNMRPFRAFLLTQHYPR